MSIPQYTRTTDPDAIAAIRAREDVAKEFHDAAIAFAAKYGDADKPGFYGGSSLGSGYYVSAIVSSTKPTAGQWTKGRADRGWRPYKTNPASAEMAALSRELPPVPGSPGTVFVDNPSSFGSYWVYPLFFIHEGVAYQSYSMLPGEEADHPLGEQWEEILPSVWHAAHEAHTGKAVAS